MNYLEQLFFEERAVKEDSFKVGEKEFTYKLGSLTYAQQLEVDKALSDMDSESSQWTIGHTYVGEVLSRTLIELNGYEFTSSEECRKALQNKSAILIEKLGKLQGDFEKEIRALLDGDTIEETFSETPSQD